ncbi:MAG: YkgJ family cysteine cluster protein [Syntrophorhabdaceae bacterium]
MVISTKDKCPGLIIYDIVRLMPDSITNHFTCRRCGACCHVDMMAYVRPEDFTRWEKEGRHDIIARMRNNEIVWAGGRIVNKSGTAVRTCFYLDWDTSRFFCQIYNTRPMVCREYVPGSTLLCPLYRKKDDT